MTIIVDTDGVVECSLAWIREAVQARGYGTDTAPFIQNHVINSVYRRVIGMHRWPFLEVLAPDAITCVAGTESYSVSSITDLLHLDAVRIAYGAERPWVEYLPPNQFRAYAHRDTDNGVPRFWTKINGSLYFWPRPDKAYTVTLEYVKKATSLVNDGDLSLIPCAYIDVIVWGACRELTYRERDGEGYDLADAEFNARLADMLVEYGLRQRQTSSTVVQTGFHDQFDPNSDPWLTFPVE